MVGLVVAPPCLGVVAGAFSTTVAGCPEDSRPMIPGLRVQRGARALVSPDSLCAAGHAATARGTRSAARSVVERRAICAAER